MWLCWLGEAGEPLVMETLDESQDVRLRLIVAALILLFCIAVTLVILLVVRGKKPAAPLQKAGAGRPQASPSEKLPSMPPPPGLEERPGSLAVKPAAAAPFQGAATPPGPSSPPRSPETSPQAATTPMPRPGAPVSGSAAPPRRTSPPAAPKAPEKTARPTARTFDPEAYKKELAAMDPEKKRQEILKRLEEIKKENRAEQRAAIRLPSVTAAPRPLPRNVGPTQSLPKLPTIHLPQERAPVAAPENFTQSETGIQADPSEKTPIPSPTAQAGATPPVPEYMTASDPPASPASRPVQNPGSPAEDFDSVQEPSRPAARDRMPQAPSSDTTSAVEDFSRLSSVQGRFVKPPPRMGFRDWLNKLEREG
ncbi:MAG: hypothetical protein NZM15_03080 [Flavobacteriales bacterium]|nr:hypothetical protein [Flavobacteriales bacterium]MDW8431670.1 hypothetical protein [Flavobacteriales bacterium]